MTPDYLPIAPTLPKPRRIDRRLAFALALIVVCVGTFLIVWNNGLRQRFVVRNWGVVEPNSIYRSGQISQYLVRDTLQKNEIDVVIFLSIDKPNRPDVQAEAAACEELGIERYKFPLDGNGTGDITQYAAALVTLTRAVEQKKQVLVHCHAGAQRTSGLIFAYRTLVQRRDGKLACDEMENFGHDPDDNPTLIPYLNDHMDELADALLKEKLIDKIPQPLPVAVR